MPPPVRELFRCPSKQLRFRGGAGEIAEMRFHPEKPDGDWNPSKNRHCTDRRHRRSKFSCSSFDDAPPRNRAKGDKNQRQIAEFREIRRGDRQTSCDSEKNAWFALGEPLGQTDEHKSETNWREDVITDPIKCVLRHGGDQKRNPKSQRNLVWK